jgi:tetratricopeptide (TPR) repeat protein
MDLQAQLQQHLGDTYVVERELGGGGMSRVFVAVETRLGRTVVVKVLSPDLAQGINVDRFEREIRLAASLQQANIVPLLTAGDLDGLPYFTMPYIDGESVRTRLTRGPLPIADVTMILRDVARALAYAHGRGVVHRDIKPDNVLLSGEAAVVTDFGIAKALSASRTAAPGATLTQLGTSIGTPAYMAPEQVAGDPAVDHRVDLYALGCTGYELLTGQAPFANRTPQQVLAAHLSQAVPSAAVLRPDTPPALAALIARLMEKDPARRPTNATEVLRALDAATTSTPTLAFSAPGTLRRALVAWAVAAVVVVLCAKAAVVGIGLPDWVFPGAIVVMLLGLPALLVTGYVQRVARRVAIATPTLTPGGTPGYRSPGGTVATMALKASPHLTWRRTWRGGAIAIAAFVVMIAAVMTSRAFGIGPWASLVAAGKLGASDRIVLADVSAPASDTGLVVIVDEAIRAALSQSSAVHLVQPSDVADVLQQMKQSRDRPLTDPAVVHEVALRTNARAILNGHIAPLGNGYAVSLDLTAANGGVVLASFQGTAASSQDLLKLIDKLTRELRGKVGESLRHVQLSIPLARATTTSLEALRTYSEAVTAHDVDRDYPRAIQLEREAIALDTTFALAWRKLGVSLFDNYAPAAESDSAFERAMRYADRLPEQEKQLALGAYYSMDQAALDRGKTIAAYQAVFALDSTSTTASTDLALYFVSGDQLDSALKYAQVYRRLAPGPESIDGVAGVLTRMGDTTAARALIDSVRTAPGTAADDDRLNARYLLAAATGKRDSMRRLAAMMSEGGPPILRFGAAMLLGNVDATQGRVRESDSMARVARQLVDSFRLTVPFADMAIAANDILLRNRAADGLKALDAALATPAWQRANAADLPIPMVVSLYALGGNPDRAESVLDHAVSATPAYRSPMVGEYIAMARGRIALARGNDPAALQQFRAALVSDDGKPGDMFPEAVFGVAKTFDRMGERDSARIWFGKYLAISPVRRDEKRSGSPTLFEASPAAADKRLGELYDAASKPAEALKYYGAFVDQWKNADPELQPVVTGIKQRMAELEKGEGH